MELKQYSFVTSHGEVKCWELETYKAGSRRAKRALNCPPGSPLWWQDAELQGSQLGPGRYLSGCWWRAGKGRSSSAQFSVTHWNGGPSQIWLCRGSWRSDFNVASPEFQILAMDSYLLENSVSLIKCVCGWDPADRYKTSGGWLLLCVGSLCWRFADGKLYFDSQKVSVWKMIPEVPCV